MSGFTKLTIIQEEDSMVWIVVIVIVALLALIYVTQYNGLVKLRNKAEAAFA